MGHHEPGAVAGLVLAGGGGRRFGGIKQLAELDGRPLVQHALDTACAASVLDRVVVVLGADADRVGEALRLGRAEPVVCSGWREGIAASLRCGVAAVAGARWIVVLLADEPRLPGAAIARVVAAGRSAPEEAVAVRARWEGGRHGHPVALRGTLAGRIAALRGDRGARAILEGAVTVEVDCSDLGPVADVDTRAQLDSLRADRPDC